MLGVAYRLGFELGYGNNRLTSYEAVSRVVHLSLLHFLLLGYSFASVHNNKRYTGIN